MNILHSIMNISYIDGLMRVYPLLLIFFSSLLYFINNSPINKLFMIFSLSNTLVNKFLKNVIFKPIMKDNNHPIVGLGKRPNGAKNCGIFKNGKKSTTYGMPSGHSQHAMAFPTFILLNKLTDNFGIILFLYLIGFAVMASRVIFKCHTTQQALAGGFVGILYAYLFTINKTIIQSYL
jgi:membrane-associated phospholipid phosphatase